MYRNIVKLVTEDFSLVIKGSNCWDVLEKIKTDLNNSDKRYKVYSKKFIFPWWSRMFTISDLKDVS